MKSLQDLTSGDNSIFGGKAVGLASLINAGFRVPEGFAAKATTLPADRWPQGERERFSRRAGELLEKGPISVRSSAIGEDSSAQSFAGLFESVLNVESSEEALGAATHCIASGYSGRVLEYAGTDKPVPVGLVLQRMIGAKFAGVCFTRDPSGKDTAVVIEAVAGLGDRLVSGHAEPERWRAYLSGLGNWECHAEQNRGVLDSGMVTKIAADARRIEEKFGHPMDLEWAVDGRGVVWWLQARPVTVTAAPPEYVIRHATEDGNDFPVTVWSNWNVRETMPDPLYPLSWTFWRDAILPRVVSLATGVPFSSPFLPRLVGLDLVHGRIYFNMSKVMSDTVLKTFGPAIIAHVDATAGKIVGDLMAKGVLASESPPKIPGLAAVALKAALINIWRVTYGLFPRRAMRVLEIDSRPFRKPEDFSKLSDDELLDRMGLFTPEKAGRMMMGIHMLIGPFLFFAIAERVFGKFPKVSEKLTTGIPANPTTQISIHIDDLAEAALPLAHVFKADLTTAETIEKLGMSADGRAWLKKFDAFLDIFGHRGPKEFDLGGVRWREDPAMILGLVRAGVISPPKETVRERIRRLEKEREEAVEEAVAMSPWWKRPIMKWFARMAGLYAPIREAPKHYTMYLLFKIRMAALEIGKRLAEKGVIESCDDTVYLEWGELIALGKGKNPAPDLASKIAQRKALYDRFLSETPPKFLRSDGVPVVEDIAGNTRREDGILCGTGVSAGTAAGPVRILESPDPSAMAEGDVLALKYADPGWTPLFPRAGAVIMEVGGLMCHAAVVAREMGIPAVFGVADATRILKNGQTVTVDGVKGIVRVE